MYFLPKNRKNYHRSESVFAEKRCVFEIPEERYEITPTVFRTKSEGKEEEQKGIDNDSVVKFQSHIGQTIQHLTKMRLDENSTCNKLQKEIQRDLKVILDLTSTDRLDSVAELSEKEQKLRRLANRLILKKDASELLEELRSNEESIRELRENDPLLKKSFDADLSVLQQVENDAWDDEQLVDIDTGVITNMKESLIVKSIIEIAQKRKEMQRKNIPGFLENIRGKHTFVKKLVGKQLRRLITRESTFAKYFAITKSEIAALEDAQGYLDEIYSDKKKDTERVEYFEKHKKGIEKGITALQHIESKVAARINQKRKELENLFQNESIQEFTDYLYGFTTNGKTLEIDVTDEKILKDLEDKLAKVDEILALVSRLPKKSAEITTATEYLLVSLKQEDPQNKDLILEVESKQTELDTLFNVYRKISQSDPKKLKSMIQLWDEVQDLLKKHKPIYPIRNDYEEISDEYMMVLVRNAELFLQDCDLSDEEKKRYADFIHSYSRTIPSSGLCSQNFHHIFEHVEYKGINTFPAFVKRINEVNAFMTAQSKMFPKGILQLKKGDEVMVVTQSKTVRGTLKQPPKASIPPEDRGVIVETIGKHGVFEQEEFYLTRNNVRPIRDVSETLGKYYAEKADEKDIAKNKQSVLDLIENASNDEERNHILQTFLDNTGTFEMQELFQLFHFLEKSSLSEKEVQAFLERCIDELCNRAKERDFDALVVLMKILVDESYVTEDKPLSPSIQKLLASNIKKFKISLFEIFNQTGISIPEGIFDFIAKSISNKELTAIAASKDIDSRKEFVRQWQEFIESIRNAVNVEIPFQLKEFVNVVAEWLQPYIPTFLDAVSMGVESLRKGNRVAYRSPEDGKMYEGKIKNIEEDLSEGIAIGGIPRITIIRTHEGEGPSMEENFPLTDVNVRRISEMERDFKRFIKNYSFSKRDAKTAYYKDDDSYEANPDFAPYRKIMDHASFAPEQLLNVIFNVTSEDKLEQVLHEAMSIQNTEFQCLLFEYIRSMVWKNINKEKATYSLFDHRRHTMSDRYRSKVAQIILPEATPETQKFIFRYYLMQGSEDMLIDILATSKTNEMQKRFFSVLYEEDLEGVDVEKVLRTFMRRTYKNPENAGINKESLGFYESNDYIHQWIQWTMIPAIQSGKGVDTIAEYLSKLSERPYENEIQKTLQTVLDDEHLTDEQKVSFAVKVLASSKDVRVLEQSFDIFQDANLSSKDIYMIGNLALHIDNQDVLEKVLTTWGKDIYEMNQWPLYVRLLHKIQDESKRATLSKEAIAYVSTIAEHPHSVDVYTPSDFAIMCLTGKPHTISFPLKREGEEDVMISLAMKIVYKDGKYIVIFSDDEVAMSDASLKGAMQLPKGYESKKLPLPFGAIDIGENITDAYKEFKVLDTSHILEGVQTTHEWYTKQLDFCVQYLDSTKPEGDALKHLQNLLGDLSDEGFEKMKKFGSYVGASKKELNKTIYEIFDKVEEMGKGFPAKKAGEPLIYHSPDGKKTICEYIESEKVDLGYGIPEHMLVTLEENGDEFRRFQVVYNENNIKPISEEKLVNLTEVYEELYAYVFEFDQDELKKLLKFAQMKGSFEDSLEFLSSMGISLEDEKVSLKRAMFKMRSILEKISLLKRAKKDISTIQLKINAFKKNLETDALRVNGRLSSCRAQSEREAVKRYVEESTMEENKKERLSKTDLYLDGTENLEMDLDNSTVENLFVFQQDIKTLEDDLKNYQEFYTQSVSEAARNNLEMHIASFVEASALVASESWVPVETTQAFAAKLKDLENTEQGSSWDIYKNFSSEEYQKYLRELLENQVAQLQKVVPNLEHRGSFASNIEKLNAQDIQEIIQDQNALEGFVQDVLLIRKHIEGDTQAHPSVLPRENEDYFIKEDGDYIRVTSKNTPSQICFYEPQWKVEKEGSEEMRYITSNNILRISEVQTFFKGYASEDSLAFPGPGDAARKKLQSHIEFSPQNVFPILFENKDISAENFYNHVLKIYRNDSVSFSTNFAILLSVKDERMYDILKLMVNDAEVDPSLRQEVFSKMIEKYKDEKNEDFMKLSIDLCFETSNVLYPEAKKFLEESVSEDPFKGGKSIFSLEDFADVSDLAYLFLQSQTDGGYELPVQENEDGIREGGRIKIQYKDGEMIISATSKAGVVHPHSVSVQSVDDILSFLKDKESDAQISMVLVDSKLPTEADIESLAKKAKDSRSSFESELSHMSSEISKASDYKTKNLLLERFIEIKHSMESNAEERERIMILQLRIPSKEDVENLRDHLLELSEDPETLHAHIFEDQYNELEYFDDTIDALRLMDPSSPDEKVLSKIQSVKLEDMIQVFENYQESMLKIVEKKELLQVQECAKYIIEAFSTLPKESDTDTKAALEYYGTKDLFEDLSLFIDDLVDGDGKVDMDKLQDSTKRAKMMADIQLVVDQLEVIHAKFDASTENVYYFHPEKHIWTHAKVSKVEMKEYELGTKTVKIPVISLEGYDKGVVFMGNNVLPVDSLEREEEKHATRHYLEYYKANIERSPKLGDAKYKDGSEINKQEDIFPSELDEITYLNEALKSIPQFGKVSDEAIENAKNYVEAFCDQIVAEYEKVKDIFMRMQKVDYYNGTEWIENKMIGSVRFREVKIGDAIIAEKLPVFVIGGKEVIYTGTNIVSKELDEEREEKEREEREKEEEQERVEENKIWLALVKPGGEIDKQIKRFTTPEDKIRKTLENIQKYSEDDDSNDIQNGIESLYKMIKSVDLDAKKKGEQVIFTDNGVVKRGVILEIIDVTDDSLKLNNYDETQFQAQKVKVKMDDGSEIEVFCTEDNLRTEPNIEGENKTAIDSIEKIDVSSIDNTCKRMEKVLEFMAAFEDISAFESVVMNSKSQKVLFEKIQGIFKDFETGSSLDEAHIWKTLEKVGEAKDLTKDHLETLHWTLEGDEYLDQVEDQLLVFLRSHVEMNFPLIKYVDSYEHFKNQYIAEEYFVKEFGADSDIKYLIPLSEPPKRETPPTMKNLIERTFVKIVALVNEGKLCA